MKKKISKKKLAKKAKIQIIPSLGIKLGYPTNAVELLRKHSRGY